MSLAVATSLEPLPAIRRALEGADEALIGVAFVHQAGVNLLAPQLRTVGSSRLVATTVFGSSTAQGLATAADHAAVRVLNPSRGTFHPKVYLARHGQMVRAVVGSANLTAGLIANVEAVVSMEGPAASFAELWSAAEGWWAHDDAVAWTAGVPAPREVLSADLLARLSAVVGAGTSVATLGRAKQNVIHEITPDGIWVETDESRAKGSAPQRVDAWMIQVAWEYLMAHGSLTNAHLIAQDGLNVKRSSFVCALLAQLPDVDVSPTRQIELRLARRRRRRADLR